MQPHVDGILIPLWEWWIVWYFFLGGIAGGAYFISMIVELVGKEEDRPIARMGYYIAFPLILICGICLILDLGMPLRFWHMLVYSKTLLPDPKWQSAISVGTYGFSVFGLFSFLSLIDTLIETNRLPWAPWRDLYSGTPRKIYAILGATAGFFLASYTGVLLSSTHISAWANSPFLSALFAASSLSTGGATIALLLAVQKIDVGEGWEKLKKTDCWAMIVEFVLLILLLVWLGSVAGQGFSILDTFLLLGVTGLLGLLLPLFFHWLSDRSASPTSMSTTVLTSLLVLVGGFILRTVIVLGGQELLG